MKGKSDMDKIAKALGAEREGKVASTGGYLGALQLLADIEARFRVRAGLLLEKTTQRLTRDDAHELLGTSAAKK